VVEYRTNPETCATNNGTLVGADSPVTIQFVRDNNSDPANPIYSAIVGGLQANYTIEFLTEGNHNLAKVEWVQGSFDIGGRLHLLRIDRFTLYFDGGGSRAWSNKPVPEFGTTYNYIGRVGGGATYRLFDNVHFMAGARYFHQSNGDVHGRINNPSYDGIETYAGLIFTF